MGGCCSGQKKERVSVLERARLMKYTRNKNPINREVKNTLYTEEELEKICQISFDYRLILNHKYSQFSKILPRLYLTGVCGLTDKNIKDNNIKSIINVSYELKTMNVNGITTIRIPVEDSKTEDISIYFDEVSDQIHKWISDNKGVVVHCFAGVSRSVTLVLAYLMKYQRKTLREAFTYTFNKRSFINPNNAFFQQLMDYEKKIFKKNTVKFMIGVLQDGRRVKVTDIFYKLGFNSDSLSDSDRDGTTEGIISATFRTTGFETVNT